MNHPMPVLLAAPGGYFAKLGNTFHQEGAIVGWEAAGRPPAKAHEHRTPVTFADGTGCHVPLVT